MGFKIPSHISWFFPYLKNLEAFKNISLNELFQYQTDELIKKYKSENIIPLLLAERFLLENIEENCFSQKLLRFVLKEKNVKGIVFNFPSGKDISSFSFIKLNNNYYFYPLEWGNISQLFISLWKKDVKFYAREIELSDGFDLKEIENLLDINKILDLSYLSQKALQALEDYLPTLDVEKLKDIQEKFLQIPEGGLILCSGSKTENILCKKNVKIIDIIKNKKTLILIKNEEVSQLKSWLEEKLPREEKVGILSVEIWKKYEERGAPLILLIGAFEHAKRLKHIKVKVFEGFTYHIIGDLYYEWKDLGKAFVYYSLAEDYTQQPIELALSKSAIYYSFGELDKAEKTLRKHLCGCEREEPLLHYNLGLVYLKKGKTKEAKFHFYKAHLLEPENTIFREALIKCLWDLKEYEELEEFFNYNKKLSDKEKIYLGKLYFWKKDYEHALKYLKGVFVQEEKDGEALLFLSWLYLDKEREVSEILLKEAKKILTAEEIEKIEKEFKFVKCN